MTVHKKEKIYIILLNLLILNFCFFLVICPYSKIIVKMCFYVGLSLFLPILFLRRSTDSFRYPRDDFIFAKPITVFLITALVATLLSRSIQHSTSIFFGRYIPYCLFFIIGVFLSGYTNQHEIKIGTYRFSVIDCLVGSFMISAIIFALGGVVDYIHFHPVRLYTVFNHFIDFYMFPMYLVFYMPVSFALAFFSKKPALKWLGLMSFCLMVFCLIWQGSRAAWLAIPGGLIFITLKMNKQASKFILLFIILFLLLLCIFQPLRMIEFNTSGPRNDLLMGGVKIFLDYPMLGSGPGMYEKLITTYSDGFVLLHAHNTYLEVASEMGILGLFAFLSIFIVFFKQGFKMEQNGFKAIRIGLEGTVIATLLYALWESIILVGFRDAPLFWFLFGLGAGTIQKKNK